MGNLTGELGPTAKGSLRFTWPRLTERHFVEVKEVHQTGGVTSAYSIILSGLISALRCSHRSLTGKSSTNLLEAKLRNWMSDLRFNTNRLKWFNDLSQQSSIRDCFSVHRFSFYLFIFFICIYALHNHTLDNSKTVPRHHWGELNPSKTPTEKNNETTIKLKDQNHTVFMQDCACSCECLCACWKKAPGVTKWTTVQLLWW